MNPRSSIDKSGAYFISQFKDQREPQPPVDTNQLKPAITISHQTGAGAQEIAGQLIRLLQKSNLKGSDLGRYTITIS